MSRVRMHPARINKEAWCLRCGRSRSSPSVRMKLPFYLLLRGKAHQDREFSSLHLLEFCESSLSLSPKAETQECTANCGLNAGKIPP